MAWSSKTLTDMKKAIEIEDWEEVKRILEMHTEYVHTIGEKKVKYDLSEMARYIQGYHESLYRISTILEKKDEQDPVYKLSIKQDVKSGIECATQFETILLDLIKIGKKLK